MKIIAIIGDLFLLLTGMGLIFVFFDDSARYPKDLGQGLILVLIPLFNIIALTMPPNHHGKSTIWLTFKSKTLNVWPIIYFRRKTLEEKKRLAELIKDQSE